MLDGPYTWLSTSGVSHDWSIPAGVKRVTLNFGAASVCGNDDILVRLGTANGIVLSGYASNALIHLAKGNHWGPYTRTNAFIVPAGNQIVGLHGRLTMEQLDAEVHGWTASLVLSYAGSDHVATGAGSVQLTDELTTVRVLSSGGECFDNGRITLFYET